MVFAITEFFARLVSWVLAHKKLLVYVGIGVLCLIAFLWIKSCFTPPPPKLDEREIQLGEKAVKDTNDALLKNVLANSEARENYRDAQLSNTNANIHKYQVEAEEKWRNASREELQAEFDRRRLASETEGGNTQ